MVENAWMWKMKKQERGTEQQGFGQELSSSEIKMRRSLAKVDRRTFLLS